MRCYVWMMAFIWNIPNDREGSGSDRVWDGVYCLEAINGSLLHNLTLVEAGGLGHLTCRSRDWFGKLQHTLCKKQKGSKNRFLAAHVKLAHTIPDWVLQISAESHLRLQTQEELGRSMLHS